MTSMAADLSQKDLPRLRHDALALARNGQASSAVARRVPALRGCG